MRLYGVNERNYVKYILYIFSFNLPLTAKAFVIQTFSFTDMKGD